MLIFATRGVQKSLATYPKRDTVSLCGRLHKMVQPRLLAIAGPLKGSTFDFGEDEVSIGRVAGASIVIDHKSVSRQHCVFHREGTAFKVRDLGSLNGTSVNG